MEGSILDAAWEWGQVVPAVGVPVVLVTLGDPFRKLAKCPGMLTC